MSLDYFRSILNKPQSEVAVVIPIYKTNLNLYERISLERCFTTLSDYKIIVLAPEGLAIDDISLLHNFAFDYERFEPDYFSGVDSYSQLLLSPAFYHRFLKYRYILIYQLDAFVFSDQLKHWCELSYSYVGAPWVGVDWFDELHRSGLGNGFFLIRPRKNMVGNGGFSLRKVRPFLLASLLFKQKAENWGLNEDLFWSFYVPNNLPFFRVPSVKTALKFSFELNPADCFVLNGQQLPFGCHAWEKYDISFWRPVFDELGYSI